MSNAEMFERLQAIREKYAEALRHSPERHGAMLVDDFNPGDHTRYIFCLNEYGDPRYPWEFHYLFSCPNFNFCFCWPQGTPLGLADVLCQLPNLNPWTARALLLFAMMYTDLEVSLEGCPE